jgi:hypothetical protein
MTNCSGGHRDVVDSVVAHIGIAVLWALPPALASLLATIHADRDADRFEQELVRFVADGRQSATSASGFAQPQPGTRCRPPGR